MILCYLVVLLLLSTNPLCFLPKIGRFFKSFTWSKLALGLENMKYFLNDNTLTYFYNDTKTEKLLYMCNKTKHSIYYPAHMRHKYCIKYNLIIYTIRCPCLSGSPQKLFLLLRTKSVKKYVNWGLIKIEEPNKYQCTLFEKKKRKIVSHIR